jgi:hypothetical protein
MICIVYSLKIPEYEFFQVNGVGLMKKSTDAEFETMSKMPFSCWQAPKILCRETFIENDIIVFITAVPPGAVLTLFH